jgi:hypothetical protein
MTSKRNNRAIATVMSQKNLKEDSGERIGIRETRTTIADSFEKKSFQFLAIMRAYLAKHDFASLVVACRICFRSTALSKINLD